MSGKTFVVICSLLFLQFAFARVTRDAPQQDPFLELISNAGNAVKDIQGKFFNVIGVKDQEELNAVIVQGSKTYGDKLVSLGEELKKTAEQNMDKIQDSEAVKQLRSRVDEAINDLKKQNPEAANNVEQLTKTSKSLIDSIADLGNSESAKQVKEIGNQILQTTVDALKDVNTKLQEAGKPK